MLQKFCHYYHVDSHIYIICIFDLFSSVLLPGQADRFTGCSNRRNMVVMMMMMLPVFLCEKNKATL